MVCACFKVYCQAAANVTIKYTSNGNDFIGNVSGEYELHATYYKAENVFYDSLLQFDVAVTPDILPGLKCMKNRYQFLCILSSYIYF